MRRWSRRSIGCSDFRCETEPAPSSIASSAMLEFLYKPLESVDHHEIWRAGFSRLELRSRCLLGALPSGEATGYLSVARVPRLGKLRCDRCARRLRLRRLPTHGCHRALL